MIQAGRFSGVNCILCYRANIFGFPNNRGLAEVSQNLNFGLLDQRLATEWVRDNIAAFGGDSSRIVMWGQSFGAASADFFNFTYAENPIISGLIMHPGNVFATGTNIDLSFSNFTFVAEHFSCGNVSAQVEPDCMRTVRWKKIIDFYESYNLNHTTGQLHWTTRWKLQQAAYHRRIKSNEQSSLIDWFGLAGPNMTLVREQTVSGKLCPVTHNAELRYKSNTTTFYFYNTGNFTNISPRPWEGAYHTPELPLLFGTYSAYGGAPMAIETAVASHWQDLYLAFIRDPVNGLPAMGWPAYKPDGSAMVVAANGTVSQLSPVLELANDCVRISETYV